MYYLTKYPEAVPMRNQTAETVSSAYYEHVMCRHGAPKVLFTDRGSHQRYSTKFAEKHIPNTSFPQLFGLKQTAWPNVATQLAQSLTIYVAVT